MDKDLKEIFKKSAYLSEEKLPSIIWERIQRYEKRVAKIKLSIFSCLGIASFVGFFPIVKILLRDLSTSGFYEYVSVAFSGNESILSFWKELSFSITESLPTASILYSLIIVFVFLLSLKYIAKQIIKPTQLNSRRGQLSLSF